MYNSQYYTCEQIDQRLLQGYLDDYNTENNTSLTKAQFLAKLGSILGVWQGVDVTPTAGSKKFVESGGVYNDIVLKSLGGCQLLGYGNLIHIPGFINSDRWVQINSNGSHIVLKVSNAQELKIQRGSGNLYVGFLKTYTPPVDESSVIDWCSGISEASYINTSALTTLSVPNDCKYIVIDTKYNNTDRSPVIIQLDGFDVMQGINSIITSINGINGTLGTHTDEIGNIENDIDGISASFSKEYAQTSSRVREEVISGITIYPDEEFELVVSSQDAAWQRLRITYNGQSDVLLDNIVNGVVNHITSPAKITTLYVDFVNGFSSGGTVAVNVKKKGINERIDSLEQSSEVLTSDVLGTEKTESKDYSASASRIQEMFMSGLVLQKGTKFTISLSTNAVWSRLRLLYNSNSSANLLKDYAVAGIEYSFVAPADINSIYVDFTNGVSTSGTVTMNLKSEGVLERIIILENSNKDNDICLPSKLYMLDGVVNDIFVEPLIKRWRPYNNDVIFSGSQAYIRKLKRVASVKHPVNNSKVVASLYERKDFNLLKSVESTVIKGIPSEGSTNINVSIIGDSFTNNGAFYKGALLANGYVPNLTLVGLRYVSDYPTQHDEGRGGWTLDNYFTVVPLDSYFFNPFMQPSESGKKYWGSKQFWVNAWLCHRGTQPAGFEPNYSCSRYSDYVSLFDESTGLKANPQSGDVMYDLTGSKFIEYNGTTWVDKAESDYTWIFSYSKYLSMWNLNTPDICAVGLGLNDFRNQAPSSMSFDTWNSHLETVIASFLSANPNGKFVVIIPSSVCGIENNAEGRFVAMQNACMWNARQNIISNFDGRENENIYVVDMGILVDSEYGFSLTSEEDIVKPFETYSGEETLKVQAGVPHPYQNYGTMGYSLAAFIQAMR